MSLKIMLNTLGNGRRDRQGSGLARRWVTLLLLWMVALGAAPHAFAQVYQINCGGSVVSPFSADQAFSGGSTAGVTNSIDTSGVTNPAPQAVYQTLRHGGSAGAFSYILPALTPNAAYTVRLHFSENYWGSAGGRVFNVTLNGSPVLTNFDIFAAAGGQFKAVVKQFNATADGSGQITAAFSGGTTGQDHNPVVSGIEVLAGATPLTAPLNLVATPGDGQAALSWSASSGAISYNVKRATTSGGPYTTIGSTASPSYTDTGLTNGTTYYYVVSAVDTISEGPNSAEVSATPFGPPAAPTKLAAQPGNQQVTLSWTASSGAAGYTVKVSATSGGPYTNVTIPGVLTGTAYTAQYLTNGTTYYYVVTAVNSSGESANSNEVSATPVGPPATPVNLTAQPGYRQVTLTWAASATATGYNVYRGTSPGGESAAPVNAAPVTSAGFTDTGLTSGMTYYYTVVAVSSYGSSPPSSEASATLVLPPDTPASLTATPGAGQVSLSWAAPSGSVTGYTVQRATTTGGPYTTLATGSPTSYTDTAVVNGTPYFYVVIASNLSGPGAASDEVMAEPFVSPAAPSVTPNYGYSSDGLRAWKSVGGSRTYFLYDGSLPVCELDGTGAVTATNTWAGSLLSRRAGSASTFYTFDPQGNVAQRLDASANVLGTYAFDAFGLRTGTDSTTDPYAGFGGTYGYYADAETGLSLLGHRYYDTGTGRFVTRDPLGYAGGADLYAYCGNNPVMATDPSGFCSDADPDNHVGLGKFLGGALDPIAHLYSNLPPILGDELGGGPVQFLDQTTHLGSGSGAFAGNPGWGNAQGLGQDIATTFGWASLLLGGVAATGDAAEAASTLRLRHYTSTSASRKIEQDETILAQDQNKVFTELAKKKPLSPRDAEAKYGLKEGRGRAYIEFDADPEEVQVINNPLTQATEHTIQGDVNLADRNPSYVRR